MQSCIDETIGEWEKALASERLAAFSLESAQRDVEKCHESWMADADKLDHIESWRRYEPRHRRRIELLNALTARREAARDKALDRLLARPESLYLRTYACQEWQECAVELFGMKREQEGELSVEERAVEGRHIDGVEYQVENDLAGTPGFFERDKNMQVLSIRRRLEGSSLFMYE